MLLLVGLMVALLGLLATLQYRWLGQVSQGERERMQSSLRAGATRFSQDFNREITRAYLNFQMEAHALRERDWSEFAERFERWNKQSPYPNLLSDVYVLERAEQKNLRLSRFDVRERKFEAVEWPADLATLRPRLERELSENRVEPDALREISLDPVEPGIPALVSPVIAAPRALLTETKNVEVVRREQQMIASDVSPLAGYIIIKLNLEVIAKEILPALSQRYFSASDGFDYNLLVINPQQPEQTIYQSTQNPAPLQPQGGDATAKLLEIQPDQLDTLFFGFPKIPAPTSEGGITLPHKLPPGKMIVRTDERSENPDSRQKSFTVRVFNRQMRENVNMEMSGEAGAWQLLIQHRAGSLETAVTSARRRSLAISFGILLLLACSVTMIVISTRRAELLAHRQMEFVSAVSHEFRTPLAVICSAGENLADGIVDAPQQVKKYGSLVHNEGRRLTEMVEQVLEFAGARSGRSSYQMQPVEVEPLIEDALSSFQNLIEEKNYIVEKEIESGLPLVEGDAAALRRSLQNLLSNAMKYETDKRWLGIRAQSAINEHGEEVRITVEDQGIGITPEELTHIFEPFYRGSEVQAAQIHGNGLGLSLVKQITEAHQGSVSVISSPGQGSSFTLHLPARERHGNGDGALKA